MVEEVGVVAVAGRLGAMAPRWVDIWWAVRHLRVVQKVARPVLGIGIVRPARPAQDGDTCARMPDPKDAIRAQGILSMV